MIPPLLIGLGLLGIVLGIAILRSFGSGYRVGRLLAATPAVTVGDAVALASTSRPRYVRIQGRIDAEDEFEDEHHRPLVLRRVRLEARSGREWRHVADHRRLVPFVVNEELDSIAIDGAALDEGLVVIPRESAGVAADAPDAFPSELPPSTPVRMRVDQVSSVDHATVCGVPGLDASGSPVMTAGAGRPLILTTLDRDEAMRVLALGSRARPIAAGAALVVGAVLLALGLAAGIVSAVAPASAATVSSAPSLSRAAVDSVQPSELARSALASVAPVRPSDPAASLPAASLPAASEPGASEPGASEPAASEPAASGDTRSAGQGPGFVGAPLLAIAGVALVAVVTIALTLAYVGLTGGPSPGGSARRS